MLKSINAILVRQDEENKMMAIYAWGYILLQSGQDCKYIFLR